MSCCPRPPPLWFSESPSLLQPLVVPSWSYRHAHLMSLLASSFHWCPLGVRGLWLSVVRACACVPRVPAGAWLQEASRSHSRSCRPQQANAKMPDVGTVVSNSWGRGAQEVVLPSVRLSTGVGTFQHLWCDLLKTDSSPLCSRVAFLGSRRTVTLDTRILFLVTPGSGDENQGDSAGAVRDRGGRALCCR